MPYGLASNLKTVKAPSTLGVPVQFASKTLFTTSGAVSTFVGDQGCATTVKPSGTGLYTLYFPALRALRFVDVTLQTTTTAGDRTAVITGYSLDTSGYCTVSVTTMAAGSAANATSGDYLWAAVWGDA